MELEAFNMYCAQLKVCSEWSSLLTDQCKPTESNTLEALVVFVTFSHGHTPTHCIDIHFLETNLDHNHTINVNLARNQI